MALGGSLEVDDMLHGHELSYSDVACVTVMTWDVLVMFSQEVECMWEALLAISLNGSTGLTYSKAQCARWLAVQNALLQVVVTVVDIILILRVYALYGRNRVLMGVIGSLFVAEIVALCYILSIACPKFMVNDQCLVVSGPPSFSYYWIISLTFETLLFALTIARFVVALRQGWGKGPIVRQFVADGTWAYALIFVTMLVNMMFFQYVRSSLTGICFTWLLVVMSFAGSRLVLNQRQRSAKMDYISGTCVGDTPVLTTVSGPYLEEESLCVVPAVPG